MEIKRWILINCSVPRRSLVLSLSLGCRVVDIELNDSMLIRLLCVSSRTAFVTNLVNCLDVDGRPRKEGGNVESGF